MIATGSEIWESHDRDASIGFVLVRRLCTLRNPSVRGRGQQLFWPAPVGRDGWIANQIAFAEKFKAEVWSFSFKL